MTKDLMTKDTSEVLKALMNLFEREETPSQLEESSGLKIPEMLPTEMVNSSIPPPPLLEADTCPLNEWVKANHLDDFKRWCAICVSQWRTLKAVKAYRKLFPDHTRERAVAVVQHWAEVRRKKNYLPGEAVWVREEGQWRQTTVIEKYSHTFARVVAYRPDTYEPTVYLPDDVRLRHPQDPMIQEEG